MDPTRCTRNPAFFLAIGLVVALFAAPINHAAATSTLLQRYVDLDEGAYSLEVVGTLPTPSATAYVVRLTSQRWRTPSEVDRSLWEHALTIIVPDNLQTTTSLLFVFGGDNDDDYLTPSESDLEIYANFAIATGSIVSGIQQIPNQPLVFTDEPQLELEEDALVAYSWDTAMGTGDYTWAAYLPMTKAVVKAMDAIQEVAAQLALPAQPENFVVAGFSKRGAVTWLAATVDERVTAIAPGVFDALNIAPSSENQRRVYGELQEPLEDYVQRKVLDRVRAAEGRRLLEIVDPYSYLEKLDLPKYLIYATGDQFFPPDSWRFYLSDLPGETQLRYIPNTNHGGDNGGEEKAFLGLLAWYQRIVLGVPRPQVAWQYDASSGELSVRSDPVPALAQLWVATNPKARDFRYDSIGAQWVSQPLAPDTNGSFAATVEPPGIGWTAFTVELTYQGVAGLPETYGTPVFITPDTYPFGLEHPVGGFETVDTGVNSSLR